jgi:hypothetical protein
MAGDPGAVRIEALLELSARGLVDLDQRGASDLLVDLEFPAEQLRRLGRAGVDGEPHAAAHVALEKAWRDEMRLSR